MKNRNNEIRVSTIFRYALASSIAVSVAYTGSVSTAFAGNHAAPTVVDNTVLLSCAREISKDQEGVRIVLPGNLVEFKDGEMIVMVKPGCLESVVAESRIDSSAADEYAQARETIEKLKKLLAAKDVETQTLEEDFKKLEQTIQDAEDAGISPKDALATDADVDAKDEGFANVAMLGAMVAACMAASAGGCAAIVALAPSLFGTENTTDEIQGMAQAAADISAGRPINAKSREILNKVAQREGVPPELRDRINEVVNGDYTLVIPALAREINTPQASNALKLLQEMASGKLISCDSVLAAAGGQQIQVSSTGPAQSLKVLLKTKGVPIHDSAKTKVLDCFNTVFVQ